MKWFVAVLSGLVLAKTATPADIKRCQACKDLSANVDKRMAETAKNTKRIEVGGRIGPDGESLPKKVIPYVDSENRLFDVLENVCEGVINKVDCFGIVDQYENEISDWFFNRRQTPFLKHICYGKVPNCSVAIMEEAEASLKAEAKKDEAAKSKKKAEGKNEKADAKKKGDQKQDFFKLLDPVINHFRRVGQRYQDFYHQCTWDNLKDPQFYVKNARTLVGPVMLLVSIIMMVRGDGNNQQQQHEQQRRRRAAQRQAANAKQD